MVQLSLVQFILSEAKDLWCTDGPRISGNVGAPEILRFAHDGLLINRLYAPRCCSAPALSPLFSRIPARL